MHISSLKFFYYLFFRSIVFPLNIYVRYMCIVLQMIVNPHMGAGNWKKSLISFVSKRKRLKGHLVCPLLYDAREQLSPF